LSIADCELGVTSVELGNPEAAQFQQVAGHVGFFPEASIEPLIEVA
jgi:hypothetical protein